MDIASLLLEYNPFFSIAGVVQDMIRWLLWGLVCILTNISEGVEGIVDKVYTLNNFFRDPKIEAIINMFKPVLWLILTLSILYIAYKIVIDREFKGERLIQNFLLASMVILVLPNFMVKLDEITLSSVRAVNEVKSENIKTNSSARNIIKDNLYDIKFLESKNFKLEGFKDDKTKVQVNTIKNENILRVPINETISRGGLLDSTNEIYKKKLELDENGETKVVDLNTSFFGLIKEEYYRFNFDFLNMIVSLLCLILVFVLTILKVSRIIVELSIKKIFAIVLAFGDIASGQKLKTVLKDILSSFAIIFVTALLLKIYMIGTTWIGTINANSVVKFGFTIGLSLMVIDGPNVIEQILGIDAGIKSGWSLIAGAYAGMKTMGELGNVAGNMMSKATSTLVGAGASAKGTYDGFKESTLEDERNSNFNDNKSNTSSSQSKDNKDNKEINNLDKGNSNETLSSEIENSNIDKEDKSELSLDENRNSLLDEENIQSGYGEQNHLSNDMREISTSEKSSLDTDISQNLSDEGKNSIVEDDLYNGKNGKLEDGLELSEDKSNINSQTLENDIETNKNPLNDDGKVHKNESLEGDIKASEGQTLNGADMNSETLDSNIKASQNGIDTENTIGNNEILNPSRNENSKDDINKPSFNEKDNLNNQHENKQNNKSDKSALENSSKLETRGIGEYAKDKMMNSLNSNKHVENAKKYYQIGKNTGNDISKYISKNNKNERK